MILVHARGRLACLLRFFPAASQMKQFSAAGVEIGVLGLVLDQRLDDFLRLVIIAGGFVYLAQAERRGDARFRILDEVLIALTGLGVISLEPLLAGVLERGAGVCEMAEG